MADVSLFDEEFKNAHEEAKKAMPDNRYVHALMMLNYLVGRFGNQETSELLQEVNAIPE